MSTCDYCAEGRPLIDGWHVLADPEGFEETAQIPCMTVSAIKQAITEASVKVGEADVAHRGEPMPRLPHEGDYPRGQRDALRWVLEDLFGLDL